MRTPRRLDSSSFGFNRGQGATAVGILTAGEFDNATFNGGVLASGAITTSGLINVAGYNSFFVLGVIDVGSTSLVVRVICPDYNDSITPLAPLFTDLVTTIAPTTGRGSFGAASGVRPSDSWGYIQIQLQGSAPLGASGIFITLLCSTR